MKRVVLFLLAAVVVAGFGGCGGGDDFSPSLSNMAGVYSFTKLTVTEGGVKVEMVPPTISGTITLNSNGTYSADIAVRGRRLTGGGTWAVSDDTIIVDGGEGSGPITDDGRRFAMNVTFDGTGIYEFTRI